MSQLKAIVDELLSGVSSMYKPEGYISEDIFPMVTSKAFTGKLAKYGSDHLRIENTRVSGRGQYRRAESISRSQSTYSIEGHGLEGMVTLADYANVQDPYKAEEDEVLGLTTMLWLEKEKSVADQVLSTSVMTSNTTLSGTGQYNDFINSSPVDDFSTARATVVNAVGAKPNKAAFDWQVSNKLRYHPSLLENLGYKYDRPDGLKADELAKAMDVDSVMIGMVRYNSAKEGQSDTLAAVWGKDIVFLCAQDKAVPYQVNVAYRVQLDGEQPRKVSKYPLDNPRGATGILVDDYYDYLFSNVAAGYLIKAAIA